MQNTSVQLVLVLALVRILILAIVLTPKGMGPTASAKMMLTDSR